MGATGSCFAPPKCNRGLEHGQPAQRTVFQVIFNGFPWVFDRSCSQSCKNGFPIVQLMFLYEARLVQEHHRHNWDPILAYLGPGGLKNLRKPIKVNVNPSKTTKKDHHICQTQVFGPRTWVRARCGLFLLFWERFKPREPGFGPDVVIFVLILLGEVHSKSDHIWPNLWLWAQNQGFGLDVFILKCSSWKSRRHHEHRGVFLGSDFAS